MISSRRRQRPLSLVVLQADPSSMNMMMHRLVQDVQRLMMQRYLLVSITRVLSRHTRRTDIIIEGQQPGRLVLLAPETTGEQAIALGERLTRVAQERMGIDANYSVASFPEQALTYEELLNVAEQRLGRQLPDQRNQLAPEDQISKLAQQRAADVLPPEPQHAAPAHTAE
jgi:GGDEF domain-containing protein